MADERYSKSTCWLVGIAFRLMCLACIGCAIGFYFQVDSTGDSLMAKTTTIAFTGISTIVGGFGIYFQTIDRDMQDRVVDDDKRRDNIRKNGIWAFGQIFGELAVLGFFISVTISMLVLTIVYATDCLAADKYTLLGFGISAGFLFGLGAFVIHGTIGDYKSPLTISCKKCFKSPSEMDIKICMDSYNTNQNDGTTREEHITQKLQELLMYSKSKAQKAAREWVAQQSQSEQTRESCARRLLSSRNRLPIDDLLSLTKSYHCH